MTAGGGRTPDSRPDAGWPEQIVSLDDLWRDEAILDALGARRALPPEALADPAAGLLAALTRDVDAADPSVDPLTDLLAAFTEDVSAAARGDGLVGPGAAVTRDRDVADGRAVSPAFPAVGVRRRSAVASAAAGRHPRTGAVFRRPVRALVIGLAAAAAVVLIAAVARPPWPSGGSSAAGSPAAGIKVALGPLTAQVRSAARHTGPAASAGPQQAFVGVPPASTPAVTGGTSAARVAASGAGSTGRTGAARSLSASGGVTSSGPAASASQAAGHSRATGRSSATARQGGGHVGVPAAVQHASSGPVLPAGVHSGIRPSHRGTRARQARSRARQAKSPAARPWRFWLRGPGGAHRTGAQRAG